MNHFPIVLVGGPPDSGKSVLTAALTMELRRQNVPHYVLRACPDGEGDWRYLADQALVRTILVPVKWTPEFVEHICRDLAHPHLPLIVDVGGRPQDWQECIFDYCSHAILLTPDEAHRVRWRDLIARHRVSLLADLRSSLDDPACLERTTPSISGVISNLCWGQPVAGPVFDALVKRMTQLFAYPPDSLRRAHLDSAPVEIVVDTDRLYRTLGGENATVLWRPDQLPAVVDYVPERTPLAVYGRIPNWLCAALALVACPAAFWPFDVRLGWVEPPQMSHCPAVDGKMLRATVQRRADHTLVAFTLPYAFIDHLDSDAFRVPEVPADRGVIIGGKLPHWLTAGIVLAYRQSESGRAPPWIAVYQPIVGGAVVVYTRLEKPALGDVTPVKWPA